MNEFSILMLLIGALLVALAVLFYLYITANNNLKKTELDNKDLIEENNEQSTEIAVLREKIFNSEKLK